MSVDRSKCGCPATSAFRRWHATAHNTPQAVAASLLCIMCSCSTRVCAHPKPLERGTLAAVAHLCRMPVLGVVLGDGQQKPVNLRRAISLHAPPVYARSKVSSRMPRCLTYMQVASLQRSHLDGYAQRACAEVNHYALQRAVGAVDDQLT